MVARLYSVRYAVFWHQNHPTCLEFVDVFRVGLNAMTLEEEGIQQNVLYIRKNLWNT